MNLIEIPQQFPAHYFSEEAGLRDRSPGVHLSDILNAMERQLNPEKYDEEGNYKSNGRDWEPYRTMGFLWEELLQQHMLDAAVRNGDLVRGVELTRDGVIMTPDGTHVQDWALEEWKATWKSMNRPIEEFYRWWWQIKAYCRALDTLTARLRVFFVNGDYRESGPRMKAWEATFTKEELDQHWEMLLNHGRKAGLL